MVTPQPPFLSFVKDTKVYSVENLGSHLNSYLLPLCLHNLAIPLTSALKMEVLCYPET